jgi:hypothetical protein
MTYYLNNNGSRWININNGKKDKVMVCFPEKGNINGKWQIKEYTVAYYEAIGNFAVAYAKINNKIEQLTDWDDGIFMINSATNRGIRAQEDTIRLFKNKK